MKILVGYDGSNVAKAALWLAADHADAFQAKVHVVTSLLKGSERQQDEIREAEAGLEEALRILKERGIECQSHLLIRGMHSGEDLVEFAREKEVDEVIVGVKRRSKVGKLLMGSTAQYVILNAHCPVVSIK